MRNDGAAHKNMEAPRSINRAMHEDGISVTSHQSLVSSHQSKKAPAFADAHMFFSNLARIRLVTTVRKR